MKEKPVCTKITIPSMTEYVAVARLAISGIAGRIGFNIEEIEDIKIAISEACTNAIQHAYTDTNQKIDITINAYTEKLEVVVQDYGKGFDPKNPVSNKHENDEIGLGLGLTFIKSLMNEHTVESQENKGTTVTMRKIKEPVPQVQ